MDYTIDEIFSKEFMPYFEAVEDVLNGTVRYDLNELEFMCMAKEISINSFSLVSELDKLRYNFFDYVYFENNALKNLNIFAPYEKLLEFETPKLARKYYLENILDVYHLYMLRYENNVENSYKRKYLSVLIEEMYS